MKNVLLVEDSFFMRNVIKKVLLKSKVKLELFDEVLNGEEAMKKVVENDFIDLVLLDLHLSKIGGLNVLEFIKSERPELKVVICSELGQRSIIEEAIEKGADDFILKPFSENDFLRTLNKVVH